MHDDNFANSKHSSALWLSGICVTLLLAICSAYYPIWNGQFVWDDSFLVEHNPLIRSPILAGEVFRHHLFLDSPSAFYRPVQNLSFIVDYWRAGLSAPSYHRTNLLVHWLNAIFTFLLAQRLCKRLGNVSSQESFVLATLVAFGWALHPVHSAITAYISGRADSLALAGFLAGWLLWEKIAKNWLANSSVTNFFTAGLALLVTLFGLCSKEIAAMGLALFLLYLFGFQRDVPASLRWKTVLGVLIVFAAYLFLRELPTESPGAASAYTPPWSQRAVLCLRALGDYGRLLVFPDRLFMERQVIWPNSLLVNSAEIDPLFMHLAWLGVCVLTLIIVSIFWHAPGQALRRLGACWFLMMILPVSNLLPLNATVAEHWLYIPSIGFFLWLAGCWIPIRKKHPRALLALAITVISALAVRSFYRAENWKDNPTFFATTIGAGGDSVRMEMNLAGEYWKSGQIHAVEKAYWSILERRPENLWVKSLLAQILFQQNRKEEADRLFEEVSRGRAKTQNEEALRIDFLVKNQKFQEASALARKAYEASPDSWLLASSLAAIFELNNQPQVSLQVIKGFAARHWWSRDAQIEVGRLSEEQGHWEQALDTYKMAASLDIRDPTYLRKAASLLRRLGRLAEAIEIEEQADRRT